MIRLPGHFNRTAAWILPWVASLSPSARRSPPLVATPSSQRQLCTQILVPILFDHKQPPSHPLLDWTYFPRTPRSLSLLPGCQDGVTDEGTTEENGTMDGNAVLLLVYCTIMILLLSILETINTIILITIMVGAVCLCLLAQPVYSCLMSMFIDVW